MMAKTKGVITKKGRQPILPQKPERTMRIFFYPHYTFGGDHDPIIDTLHPLVDDQGEDIKHLSEKSRVSRSTLRNWFNGKTISPRNVTLCAVAGALGYEYKLVKRKIKA